MNDEFCKIERVISSLLPAKYARHFCMSVLAADINHVNALGKNKWGAYYQSDRIRLLVGSMIVFTVHRGGIWLPLDRELLTETPSYQEELDLFEDWKWDSDDYPEYTAVPSINGTYFPTSEQSPSWYIVKELHYAFLSKVVRKYHVLKISSQRKHSTALLQFLRQELGLFVPNPDYDLSVGKTDLQSIEVRLPEEFIDDYPLFEGCRQTITVNAYERNPKAREKCIEYYGAVCSACNLNLGSMYGEVGEGFIHVHHLTRLSEIGKQYQIDPIKDLRPVCPNCHAIIHRRKNEPYSIEEVKDFIKKAGLLRP